MKLQVFPLEEQLYDWHCKGGMSIEFRDPLGSASIVRVETPDVYRVTYAGGDEGEFQCTLDIEVGGLREAKAVVDRFRKMHLGASS